jgi:hypothetical protein
VQRAVFIIVVIVIVFIALGLLVPQTRHAILEGIGNAWDALTRDLQNSGV